MNEEAGRPQSPTPTRVDVVVVTYNSAEDIGGFLDSLDVLADEVELRVIVSDNASVDGTVELARRHRRTTQVLENGGNGGYAAGINAATAHLDEAALTLVANPDLRFLPGFVTPVLEALTERDVGVVAGRLVDDDGRVQPSLRREPSVGRAIAEAVLGGRRAARLGLGEVVAPGPAYARAGDVDWVQGALLLVTPECRRRVGDWDERYFLYSEETDYLLRVRDAGLRVRYAPGAVAAHRGGTSHVDARLWSLLTSNRVRLFRSRHGRLHTAAFWFAVLLNELLRSPRSHTHRQAAVDLLRRYRSLLN